MGFEISMLNMLEVTFAVENDKFLINLLDNNQIIVDPIIINHYSEYILYFSNRVGGWEN